jgi:hypothetical protein
MKGRLRTWTVLALGALLTGCAMCQTPFDYCGPVTDANGCPNCNFGARRGSIFSPTDGTPATTPRGPTEVKSPAQAPTQAPIEPIPEPAMPSSPDETPTFETGATATE